MTKKAKNKKIIFGMILFLTVVAILSANSAIIPITNCKAEDSVSTKSSFPGACDYPDGSALIANGGTTETHTFGKAVGTTYYYGGIFINSTNATVTNCSSIQTVMFCYEWWRTNKIAADCDVSVDADNGASYTVLTTTCPGITSNPGVTCVNVTSLEPWSCSNFFGTATGAVAKSELRGNGTGGAYTGTATWDVFYFNVTYTTSEPLPIITLIEPANNTEWFFPEINLTYNVSSANNIANCSLYLNSLLNQTNTSIARNTNQTFVLTNLSNGNYSWYINCTDSSGIVGKSQTRSFSVNLNTTVFNTTINDANNTPINTTLTIFDENGTLEYNETLTSHKVNVPKGIYKVKINPVNNKIKEIIINNLDTTNKTILETLVNIDQNPTNITGISTALLFDKEINITNKYAIYPDPNLIFKNVTITTTAIGTELYKCADWNFTERLCMGTWDLVKSLTPGQDYVITINSTDPGFVEANVAVNTAENYTEIVTSHYNVSIVTDVNSGLYGLPAKCISKDYSNSTFLNNNLTCVAIGSYDGTTAYTLGYDRVNPTTSTNENGPFRVKVTSTIRSDKIQTWYAYDNYLVGRTQFINYAGNANDGFITYFYTNDTNTVRGEDSYLLRYAYGQKSVSASDTSTATTTTSYDTFDTSATAYTWVSWYSNQSNGLLFGQVVRKRIKATIPGGTITHFTYDTETTGSDFVAYENEYKNSDNSYTNFDIVSGIYYFGAGTSNATVKNIYLYYTNPATVACVANCSSASFLEKEFIYEINASNKNSTIFNITGNPSWGNANETVYFLIRGLDNGTYVFNSSSNAVSWKNWTLFMNKTQLQRNADNTTIFAAVIGKTETVFFKVEKDMQAPEWSSNITNPATPAIYNSSQIYYFNVTWLDNVAIDTVKIEHNFTGTLTNYTLNVTNATSGLYSYNITGLNAGSYVWRMYANDTEGNLNYTPQFNYTVNKANATSVFTVNQSIYPQGLPLGYGYNIYIPFNLRLTDFDGNIINNSDCYVTNDETTDNITLIYNETTGNYTGQLDTSWLYDLVSFNVSCSNSNFNILAANTSANVWMYLYLWNWYNLSYSTNKYDTNWLRKNPAAGSAINLTYDLSLEQGKNLIKTFYLYATGTNGSIGRDFEIYNLHTTRLNVSVNDTACKPYLCTEIMDYNLNSLIEQCGAPQTISANTPTVIEHNITGDYTLRQNQYLGLSLNLNCSSAVDVKTIVYYNYTGEPANIEAHRAVPNKINTNVVKRIQLESNYTIGPNSFANVSRKTLIQFNNSGDIPKYRQYYHLSSISSKYNNNIVPNTTYIYNSTDSLWASDNLSAGAPNLVVVYPSTNIIYWVTETIPALTTINETLQRKEQNAIRDNETLIIDTTNQKEWNIVVDTIYNSNVALENVSVWTNYSAYGADNDWCTTITKTENGNTTDITSEAVLNTTAKTIIFPTINLSGDAKIIYSINAVKNYPPSIALHSPENNAQLTSPNFTFNFTATDDLNTTLICSIYLDDKLNQTNSSVQNGTLTIFTIPNITSGQHSWFINCSDEFCDKTPTSNVSETRYFNIKQTTYCNGSYVENTDWEITTPTICENEIIPLKGNLTINSGASLVFNNITLLVNSTSPGQYKIEVNDNFTINNSEIKSADTKIYFFRVNAGTFKLLNSKIYYVGNQSISNSTDSKITGINGCNDAGLAIRTNNVLINNSLIAYNINGLCIQDSSGHLIQNSTIMHNWGNGIYFWNSSNSIIENCYFLDQSWHVEIDEDSSNITIRHSTFDGNGDDQDAIDIWGNNNTIYNNTIYGFTILGVYIDGVYIGNATGNNISNNYIHSNSAPTEVFDAGIELTNAIGNIIENNIIENSMGGGFYLYEGANYNNFSNNIIRNIELHPGIILETDCNNNLFNNNQIINASNGTYIYQASNNIFIGNTINDSRDMAVYSEESEENIFIDSEISNSTNLDFGLYVNSTLTALNTTFDHDLTDIGDVNDASVLYVKWYLDVYANYTNGTLAENANVTAYDINGNLVFNKLTNALGYIPRQNVTEYYQNKTGKYYLTNYTLNATKDSYNSLNKQLNLTTNYLDREFFLTLDIEIPVINVANATPQIVNPGDAVNITANVTDDTAVSDVLVDINNTGNQSMTYYISNIYYYDSFNTNISPGVYTFVVYANDTLNNWAIPKTGNFTVNAVCGIALSGNISFGNVNVGAESSELVVNISNTGNALSNITIRGTNWNGPVSLPVSKTAFSNETGNFASKTLLQLTDQFVQQLNAWSTFPLYFQFKPDFGTNAGDYTQNITITTTC